MVFVYGSIAPFSVWLNSILIMRFVFSKIYTDIMSLAARMVFVCWFVVFQTFRRLTSTCTVVKSRRAYVSKPRSALRVIWRIYNGASSKCKLRRWFIIIYSNPTITANNFGSRTPEVKIHSSSDGRKCVICRRKRYNWWVGKGYAITYTRQSSSDRWRKSTICREVEKRRLAVSRPHIL